MESAQSDGLQSMTPIPGSNIKVLFAKIDYRTQRWLRNTSSANFVLWCMTASFGAYLSMYAFRKPFIAGEYRHYHLWGLDYKVVLIIAQLLGYMLSKFIGIKIISELRPAKRIKLITGLILFAEASLLLFALIPFPYNWFCLFLNGLPLGMIWGVVFSFLEGRRFTEVLGFGLNISIIIASGIMKTVYLTIQQYLHASEFWMPFIVGALFFPVFCLFVWMLSVIPAPTEKDRLLRAKRIPMTKATRRQILRDYAPGLLLIIIVYTFLTMIRDFRDNFSVEIWNEMDPHWSKDVLAETELITGVIVLAVAGAIAAIRSNLLGLRVTHCLMMAGILLSGIGTLLFHLHLISPFLWMLVLGMGLYFAYIPMQNVFFERMIGLFRIRANAGFFVYLCDSAGYLGSMGLMLYKEFFMPKVSWVKVLISFSCLLTGVCMVLMVVCLWYFNTKFYQKKKELCEPLSLPPGTNPCKPA